MWILAFKSFLKGRFCFIGYAGEYSQNDLPFLVAELPDLQAIAFFSTLVAVRKLARVSRVRHIGCLQRSNFLRE